MAMTGSQGKKKETLIPFSPFTRTVARALIHSPMWHLGTRVEEEGGEIGVGEIDILVFSPGDDIGSGINQYYLFNQLVTF